MKKIKNYQVTQILKDTVAYGIVAFAWVSLGVTWIVLLLTALVTKDYSLIMVLLGFGIFQIVFLKDIPSTNPPSVLLLTLFGMRTSLALLEGWKLVPKWLGISGILIGVQTRNHDFAITVRTKGESNDGKIGPDITIRGSVTYIPDSKNLIRFVNNTFDEGVLDILDDRIKDKLRQVVKTRTWQEVEHVTDELAVEVILHLVNDSSLDQEKIREYESSDDQARVEFVKKYLHSLLKNGLGDDHNLGIKIYMVNIVDTAVSKKLQDEAEGEAIEMQQKKAQLREAETIKEVAEVLAQIEPEVREDAMVVAGKIRKQVVGGKAGDFTKGAVVQSPDEVNK
jgi:hypothetical protein